MICPSLPSDRGNAAACWRLRRRSSPSVLRSGRLCVRRRRNAISQVGIDKYGGRIDALVATRDAADVSAALLNGGFARSYDGGAEAGAENQRSDTGFAPMPNLDPPNSGAAF